VKQLRCRAHETLEMKMMLDLVGEADTFAATQYLIDFDFPRGCEFIRSAMEVRALEVHRKDSAAQLEVSVAFAPKRPISQTVSLVLRNPQQQEWQFKLDLGVERGLVTDTITVESLLNKTGTARVHVPVIFRAQTPFRAYFAPRSASEFSVTPDHGMIEPTLLGVAEIPVDVVFAPKMYGKVLKGLLVVDTIDSQFLFDVVGKTPEYVPPVPKALEPLKEARPVPQASPEPPRRKRNVIRDNIENCHIVKPRRSQSVATPGYHFI